MLDTAARLLYTDRLSVEGMLARTFPFDDALEAYRWLEREPAGRGEGRTQLRHMADLGRSLGWAIKTFMTGPGVHSVGHVDDRCRRHGME